MSSKLLGVDRKALEFGPDIFRSIFLRLFVQFYFFCLILLA